MSPLHTYALTVKNMLQKSPDNKTTVRSYGAQNSEQVSLTSPIYIEKNAFWYRNE